MHKLPLAFAFASFCLCSPSLAQLTVMSVDPGQNAGNVAEDADILITCDRPVNLADLPPSTASASVFGKATGPAAGSWSVENGGLTLRFTPAVPFAAGEVVQVSLNRDLVAADGQSLRSAGYHFEYRVRTLPNTLDFTELETISVRTTPSQGVRVYGGQATDLNDDGWLDLAIVNQDSSDVRVLLSQGDGEGGFDPFLTPPTGTGDTPSPNESCDMNGDGIVDIVTGDKFGDTVTILIGQGDGTFAAPASYSMGDLPRGLAVFDMNGDGHQDVACCNANSSDVSIRLGNGDGTLGAESTFEGGGFSEWSMGSGDMNGDGIMDMVIGARSSERLIVWLGNGDGTFTQGGVLNDVDRTWMVVLGDVNGDGHLDVSSGNGTSSTGTIAFGDGAGNLSLGPILPAGGLVVATDLGDLDGDGDLDWILSAFSGERWTLYENDGTGAFTLSQEFQATENPACAVLFDFDGDRDLDIALLDEIADEVVLMENTSPATSFCTPTPNSTGFPALAGFSGSSAVAENDFNLHLSSVPDGFGIFFYGQVTTAGTAQGNGILCLGSPVYRSPIGLAQAGLLQVTLDLTQPPVAAATILPGSTWHFQGVFRDPAAGGALFNFSDGLSLTFL